MTTLEIATPVRNGTASWPGLGTYVHLSTADGTALEPARQIAVRLLEDVDRTCSRFRKDSDLIRANAGAGSWVSVDPMLVKAVGAAVESAAQTDGLVDPTLGHALVAVGYDRDISLVLAAHHRDHRRPGRRRGRAPALCWAGQLQHGRQTVDP